MSLTKQQLEALNNNSFPNNNAGYITPDILRNYNSSSIAAFVDENTYLIESASFSDRINQGGGNIDTGSFATTGSNTFVGNQFITGSDGDIILRGSTANTTDNALLTIHAVNDGPWIGRYFNDTFSTSSSVLSFWGDNDGTFHFHNESTASIKFGVNNYGDNLILNDTNITSNRDLIVNGTLKPNQIDVSSGSIVETTGSFVATFTSGGILTYDTYQNVATALQPYISGSGGNINTSSFATTGSNSFTGSQSILSGSIAIRNNGNISSFSDTELNIETTNAPAAGFIVSFNQTASAAVISYDGSTYDNELWTIADSAGIRMTDWDGGTGNLSAVPFLSVGANNGSQPAPQFKRGLGVTGSVYVSGGIDTTGKVNIHSNFANGLTIDHTDGGNSLMAYANLGEVYWATGYITGSDAYQIYNTQTFSVPFSIAQNNNVTFAGNIYATNLTGSTINTGSFATTGSNLFIGNQSILSGSLYMTGSIRGNQVGYPTIQLSGKNNNGTVTRINSIAPSQIQIQTSGSAGGATTLLGANTLNLTNNTNGDSAILNNIGIKIDSNDGAGGFDSFYLDINGGGVTGTTFSDYDNTIQDYSPWLNVGPNDGVTIPTPTFSRGLTLSPIGAPSSPTAGTIYFSSADAHFYGWNGSDWKQLDNTI